MAPSSPPNPEASPESRTSTFSRKRTNSLATTSRKKALKRNPRGVRKGRNGKSNGNKADADSDASSAEEGEVDVSSEGVQLAVSDQAVIDEDEDDNSEPDNVNGAGPAEMSTTHNLNDDNAAEPAVEPHPNVNGSTKSADNDEGTRDNSSTNSSPKSAKEFKKQQRRERQAARKERSRQRKEEKKAARKLKGGAGGAGSDDNKEEGEGDQDYDDDDGASVGNSSHTGKSSTSVSSSQKSPKFKNSKKDDILAANTDFIPIEISDDEGEEEEGEEEEDFDKDMITRRQQEDLPKSISEKNAPSHIPSHDVIDIPSDSESSLEEGEEPEGRIVPITKPLPTYPPQNIPRLRLLMTYYTTQQADVFPHEEERELFEKVDTSSFLVPPPKRRKVHEDTEMREFFDRHICTICSTEGHAAKDCEHLKCSHCHILNDHFSHACPLHKDTAKEGDKYQWHNPPPRSIPRQKRKARLDGLRTYCYACGSEYHYGDDCEYTIDAKGGKRAPKGIWSVDWVKKMGWFDSNATGAGNVSPPPPPKKEDRFKARGDKRDGGRQGDNKTAGGDNYRPGGGNGRRDQSPPRRFRDGGRGNDTRGAASGGGGGNRRASPPPPPALPRKPPPPLPREPLPPPVGYGGNGEGAGGGGAGGGGRRGGRRPHRGRGGGGGGGGGRGDGGPLAERIRMMPSSGKREWNTHSR